MPNSPQTLTVVQANVLLEQLCHHTRTKSSIRNSTRNHLIGLLMLDAGLRVGEVVQLEVSDLWIAGEPVSQLRVRPEIAKRSIERMIPTSARLREAITKMYNAWWAVKVHITVAIPSTFNCSTLPLTTRQVERIIGTAAEKAIGRWIHPHVLRHTFASMLVRVTNLRVVQELLGHKRVTSTQIYTHPNSDDLSDAIHNIQERFREKSQQNRRPSNER